VLSTPLRGAVLAGAIFLLALIGGPIAVASAEVTASQITSPASPAYTLTDETPPPHQTTFTVTGTTTGSGNVALRCYYGIGPNEYTVLFKEVTPSGNAFSVEVTTEELYEGPCVLRAVPVGNNEPHPLGTAGEEAKDPFQGPRVGNSYFELDASAKTTYGYELELNTLSSYLNIDAAGNCGLDSSNLLAPETLARSEYLFDCNGGLYDEEPVASGKATRSEIQVDGANAYSPAAANGVQRKIEEELTAKKEPLVPVADAPQVTVTKTFESASALATIHESDPIVKCSPEPAVFPPTAASCKEFVSTGVQLERTWQTSQADRVASMTDEWSSTDGAAHSLSAIYDQAFVANEKEGASYRFPGTSAFTTTATGQLVGLPAGGAAIYYKEDAATPVDGDDAHPQGAIVYDRAPSEPLSFREGTHEASKYSEFEMPYQATVPASGAYTVRMTFVQAYALAEVQSLAAAALATYQPPALTISSPASGTAVSTSSVTVSGTATASAGTPSLTVAGHAVSVSAGGAWSTSVALAKGANTITAVATDQAGLSTGRSIAVTYTPIPPLAHASQVGSASGANGEVKFTVACSGAAGTSCEIESTLTTLERTRNGHPVAVSARRHRPRTHSRSVVVGSSKLTIPAGQRVTIAIQLNAAGRDLLARFGRLPVHLRVLLLSAGHRSTVIAQNLTVRPHHHRHRRHHHHRH
jgi:hypothetical protein